MTWTALALGLDAAQEDKGPAPMHVDEGARNTTNAAAAAAQPQVRGVGGGRALAAGIARAAARYRPLRRAASLQILARR